MQATTRHFWCDWPIYHLVCVRFARRPGSMDGAIRDLCSAVENHKIVAVLVVGSNAAARGVAMAAGAAGLPVLWARNDTHAPFYQQVGQFFHQISSILAESSKFCG